MGPGGTDWYFILPSGALHGWDGVSLASSPLVATLDASYNADPSLLHDAQPSQGQVPVALTVLGDQLTIDPDPGYVGAFVVTASVSDGIGSVFQSFQVEVTGTANNLPTLDPVADQTMPTTQDTLVLTLVGNDVDGDPLSYTAEAAADSLAYTLDQTYGFYQPINGYYENFRGAGEKYLQGDVGPGGTDWYFILPSGALHGWDGVSLASSPLVATLDASYNADPSLLHDAQPSQGQVPVALTVLGDQLTIDPDPGYVGAFVVTASVSDGIGSVFQSFQVEVTGSSLVDTSSANIKSSVSLSEKSALDSDGDGVS